VIGERMYFLSAVKHLSTGASGWPLGVLKS